MKTLLSFFSFLFISIHAFAVSKTPRSMAIDWSEPSSWSPSGVPANGDEVTIPAGYTVTIKSDIYKKTAPNLTITISGTLTFKPSGVLGLGVNSTIYLTDDKASITSNGTASELININNVTKYSGSLDGALVKGPAYASASTGPTEDPGGGFHPIPLPITLVRFTAKSQNEAVVLTWQTAIEENAHRFEIERSTDARHWQMLATLPTKGANSTYSFTDAAPLGLTSFYRLKMVDNDATFSYSPVAKVATSTAAGLQVGPNPATDYLNVSLAQPGSQLLQVQVLTNSGQVVKQVTAASTGFTRLELRGLVRGFYYLVVRDQRQVVESRPFIIR